MQDFMMLEKIEQAIRDYYFDLDMRKHGGVAMNMTFGKIEKAMGMSWKQGEERKKREADNVCKL